MRNESGRRERQRERWGKTKGFILGGEKTGCKRWNLLPIDAEINTGLTCFIFSKIGVRQTFAELSLSSYARAMGPPVHINMVNCKERMCRLIKQVHTGNNQLFPTHAYYFSVTNSRQ